MEKSIDRPPHVSWINKKIQNCPGILTPWWQDSDTVHRAGLSRVHTSSDRQADRKSGNAHLARQRCKTNKIWNESSQAVIHAGWHPSHAKDSLEIQSKHDQADDNFANHANRWGPWEQNTVSHERQSIGATSSLSKLKWYHPSSDRSWHKETHPFGTLPQVVYSGTTFNLANSWKIFEVRTIVTGDLKDLKSAWGIC